MVLFLSQKSFISLSQIDEIIFSKYNIICLGKNLAPDYLFLSIFAKICLFRNSACYFSGGGGAGGNHSPLSIQMAGTDISAQTLLIVTHLNVK
jgi:hypothetical protein